VPVPSKVIATKGYKVDKKGDIVGKGHPKRDVVEWMIPPLWPWKIITLPGRGPRPALKGESQITVRLMDDIEVPRNAAAYRPASYDRPPAYYRRQSFDHPVSSPKTDETLPKIENLSIERQPAEQEANPAQALEVHPAPAIETQQLQPLSADVTAKPELRVRMIALKSQNVYVVTHYRIDGGSVRYELTDGKRGSIDVTEVDWRTTSRLNAEPTSSSANMR
jgi:hypothetical protein